MESYGWAENEAELLLNTTPERKVNKTQEKHHLTPLVRGVVGDRWNVKTLTRNQHYFECVCSLSVVA